MTPDYERQMDERNAFVDALCEENERLKEFLEREGYRRCDIAACNCGSWHRH